MKPPASRRFLPDTRRRDAFIAVAAGAVVLAFIFYAIGNLSRQVNASAMVEGVIVSKTFVPRSETQITVGKGGMDRRQLAGDYSVQVRVPAEHDREYKVWVDPATYASRGVGDHLLFQRPAPPQ